MPVYRGEQFVAAAIESVLAQTYRSFELVIVNDGSPDGSARKISRFIDHPQIRYIEQANAGVAAARNTGLGNARGDLIALLDQDDLWLPAKLERQVAFLNAHAGVGLVHSRVECINAAGETCPCTGAIWVYPFEGLCAGRLLLGNGIAPLTVLTRRVCIDDVGGFDQRFAPADDWELWMRIARRHAFGFMDEATARYRVHEENVSKDHLTMQQTVLSVIDSICERFPDVPRSVSAEELALARGRALSWAAETLERRGRRSEARKYWKEAYRTTGDFDALLALVGMSVDRRRNVHNSLRGSPRLRRLLTWYSYKASTKIRTRARAGEGNG
jgi:glycosyltransferase involved in cell wall biosynthesis